MGVLCHSSPPHGCSPARPKRIHAEKNALNWRKHMFFLNKLLCLPRKNKKKLIIASWSWCYWLSAEKKKLELRCIFSHPGFMGWIEGKTGNCLAAKPMFFAYLYTLKNRCVVYLFHETKSGNVESVPNTFTAPLDTQQMFQKDLFEAKKKRRCVGKKYW